MPLLLYLILQQALLLEFRIGVEKKRKKDLNLNEAKHVDRYAKKSALVLKIMNSTLNDQMRKVLEF
jgi:hypothetical protein